MFCSFLKQKLKRDKDSHPIRDVSSIFNRYVPNPDQIREFGFEPIWIRIRPEPSTTAFRFVEKRVRLIRIRPNAESNRFGFTEIRILSDSESRRFVIGETNDLILIQKCERKE